MSRSHRQRELYETWVRDHAAHLYRYAFRLCGEDGHAEDLVQETFYHAWRSIGKLREPARARAWLFQMLRYRYAHWLRDSGRRVRPKASVEEMAGVLSAPGVDVLSLLSQREALQGALDALDERYKESFLMVFLQGLSCRETAERLDVPLGTVLSRIHRARSFLREHLRTLDLKGDDGERTRARGRGDASRQRPRFRTGGES